MNEQKKKDAEGSFIEWEMNHSGPTGINDISEQMGEMLESAKKEAFIAGFNAANKEPKDPKPDHPTDGEIVEFVDSSDCIMYGKAFPEGILISDNPQKSKLTIDWENVEKIVRILDKPGMIHIMPPDNNWDEIRFVVTVGDKTILTQKRITRSEVEKHEHH